MSKRKKPLLPRKSEQRLNKLEIPESSVSTIINLKSRENVKRPLLENILDPKAVSLDIMMLMQL